jgi:hypothetical protein
MSLLPSPTVRTEAYGGPMYLPRSPLSDSKCETAPGGRTCWIRIARMTVGAVIPRLCSAVALTRRRRLVRCVSKVSFGKAPSQSPVTLVVRVSKFTPPRSNHAIALAAEPAKSGAGMGANSLLRCRTRTFRRHCADPTSPDVVVGSQVSRGSAPIARNAIFDPAASMAAGLVLPRRIHRAGSGRPYGGALDFRLPRISPGTPR